MCPINAYYKVVEIQSSSNGSQYLLVHALELAPIPFMTSTSADTSSWTYHRHFNWHFNSSQRLNFNSIFSIFFSTFTSTDSSTSLSAYTSTSVSAFILADISSSFSICISNVTSTKNINFCRFDSSAIFNVSTAKFQQELFILPLCGVKENVHCF